MSYTITTMRDITGMQELNLGKTGNQYLVGYYNKGTSEYTHKKFDTIEAAEKAFFKIASCFIHGEHSPADRAKMLLDC